MTSERKKILKRGFAKIIDEERNYISIGNVKLGRKSKWVMKYVILSKDANGIPSLIIYESQSDAENHQPKRIILIRENTEARQTQPIDGENFCLLIINNSKDSIIFACNFYGEIIDWQTYINEAVKDIKATRERRKKLPPIPLPARSTEREKKDDSNYMMPEGHTNPEPKGSNKYDTEDNEIYGGSNMYTVEVQENESSNRLNLHGNYTLKLYDDGFQLLDKVTENVLYSWPVAVLRRYGSSNSKFSFESGRRSQTGVGNFIFLTPFCKRINQSVYNMTQHAKSLSSLDLKVDSGEQTDSREKAQRLDSREYTNSPELPYDDPKRRKEPSFESNNYSMEAPPKAKAHSTSLSEPISEEGVHLHHQGIAYDRSRSPLSPLSSMHYQNRTQSDLASDRFAEKSNLRQRDQPGHGDFVMRGSLEAPQDLNHGRLSPSFVSPTPSPNMPLEINSDDEENYKGQPIIKSQFGDINTTAFGLNLEPNSTDQNQDYINVKGPTRIDSGPQYGSTEKQDHVFEQKNDNIPQYNRWRSESDPKHSQPFQVCETRGQQGTYVNVQPPNADPTPRFEAAVYKDTQEGPRYSNQQLMQQQMLGASFPQQRPYLQPQMFPVPEQSIETPISGYYNLPQSMSALNINELTQRRPVAQDPQLNSRAGEIMRHQPQNIHLEKQRQFMSIQQSSSYPQVTVKNPIQQQDQHEYPETRQMVLNPYNYQGTPQQLPAHSQANNPHGYTVSGPTLTVNSIMQPTNVPGMFSNSAPSTMKHPQPEYRRPDQ